MNFSYKLQSTVVSLLQFNKKTLKTQTLTDPLLLSLFKFHSCSYSVQRIQNQEPELHCELTHRDWLSRTQVLKIFERIENPNTLIESWNRYTTRKDYNPNEPILTIVITKLAVAKNFDAIEGIVQSIRNRETTCRLSDGFFHIVVKIYAQLAGRIRKAIEVLYDMPVVYDCCPNVRTFNLLLNVLVSNRFFDVAREVYAKAPSLGVEIDSCCLNILIKGLCENGELESAISLLDEFPKQRCKPNERTYSTLMNATCDEGEVDGAFDLLDRMEREGIEPDTITFNVLISGLRKLGKVEEAMGVLEGMKAKGCEPNEGSYQEILYGLIELDRFAEAKEIMGRMVCQGMRPSFVSYKKLIDGLCKARLLHDIDLILKEMVRQGFVPKMGMWRLMVHSMLNESRNHAIVDKIISLVEWSG